MEYKIIHGKDEVDIERKINAIGIYGWKVLSFNTTMHGEYGVYIHVLMVKD